MYRYTSAGTCPAGALSPALVDITKHQLHFFSFPIFHFLLCFFALLPLKLIMRLRSICSSSALVRTRVRRRGRERGGGETVAGERFAGGTTPFARCVKRSKVNLAKVDNDEESERGGGECRAGGHGQRRFHSVSKPKRTQRGKGRGREGALELSYKPSQLLGNVVFVATHTCGTYMLLLLQACCTNTLPSNCATRRQGGRGSGQSNLCSAQQ